MNLFFINLLPLNQPTAIFWSSVPAVPTPLRGFFQLLSAACDFSHFHIPARLPLSLLPSSFPFPPFLSLSAEPFPLSRPLLFLTLLFDLPPPSQPISPPSAGNAWMQPTIAFICEFFFHPQHKTSAVKQRRRLFFFSWLLWPCF